MAFDALKDVLNDAPVREKLDAEFWSPKAIGDTVLGRIGDFDRRFFGEKERRSFTLTPVILYPKDGAPQGFAEIRVGLNAWLVKLIREADRGKTVAIIYLGKQDTPAGKMFKYSVRDVAEAKLTAQLALVAPGLELARLPDATARAGDPGPREPEAIDEDDLPF